MNDAETGWRVVLAAEARTDLAGIVAWTRDRFGPAQARRYGETLRAALRRLAAGPAAHNARRRDDIGAGIHTLHAGQRGRPARHIIIFRIAAVAGRDTVIVLRVLHDAMDPARHIPPDDETAGGPG